MKHLLIIMTLFGCSLSVDAKVKTRYWNCMQVGQLDNTAVVVLSSLQESRWTSYKEREQEFVKAIQKKWKLTKKYDPLCQDFTSLKIADEVYKRVVSKAINAKLTVLSLEFKFKSRKQ